MTGYLNGQRADGFTDIFDDLRIPRVARITTAWQLFSADNTGESRKYEFDGKDIHILIDHMKELGLYKAETREEP